MIYIMLIGLFFHLYLGTHLGVIFIEKKDAFLGQIIILMTLLTVMLFGALIAVWWEYIGSAV